MPFFVLSPLPPGQTGTLAQYTRRPLTKSHFFGARTGSRKIPALITLAGVRFQYPHRNVTWPPVVCQRGRPPVKEVCPQNKPCRNTLRSIETDQFNPAAKLALILCTALDKKLKELFYFA